MQHEDHGHQAGHMMKDGPAPELPTGAIRAGPICGMALGPMLPADEPGPELLDFTRRMWVGAAAAIPLRILTMGGLVGLPVRDRIGQGACGKSERAFPVGVAWSRGKPVIASGGPDVFSCRLGNEMKGAGNCPGGA